MTVQKFLELTPDQVATFPSKGIQAFVSGAIALDREIKLLTKFLDLAKSRLVQEAEAEYRREFEHGGPQQQEGTSWSFVSLEGEAARVTFPEKGLVRSFWLFKGSAWAKLGRKTAELGDLKGLCGKFFDSLFVVNYKPAASFRDLLKALFREEPSTQRKILKMVEVSNSPRVSFGTAVGEDNE